MSEEAKTLERLTGAAAKWVHHERAFRIGKDPKEEAAMVRSRDRVVSLLEEYDRREP